jgi:hypothetical protein
VFRGQQEGLSFAGFQLIAISQSWTLDEDADGVGAEQLLDWNKCGNERVNVKRWK